MLRRGEHVAYITALQDRLKDFEYWFTEHVTIRFVAVFDDVFTR